MNEWMRWITLLASLAAFAAAIVAAVKAGGLRTELGGIRVDSTEHARSLREEVSGSMKTTTDTLTNFLASHLNTMSGQLASLTESNEKSLQHVRETLNRRLEEFSVDCRAELTRRFHPNMTHPIVA